MKYLDAFLNRITMYMLLVYGLGGVALLSIFFAAFGLLPTDPLYMLLSFIAILMGAYGAEKFLSTVFGRPMNRESWLITALILFLILPPAQSGRQFVLLGLAGCLASGSKLLLRWHGKHIFNPAAFAAAILSLTALWPASWWVGSNTLWPFALIVGLLVVRKIRHFGVVGCFVAASLGVTLIQFTASGQFSFQNLQHALIASPLIFLGTIMLTEPATMPARKLHQYIYAGLVGLLSSLGLNIGALYIYPEVALLLGNIYAYIVSPKFATSMSLVRIETVSENIMNFVFTPHKTFSFLPGQYMEWTLPDVKFDTRGNRRTFTIASAPTEDEIMLGVKFYSMSSAYKQHLRTLRPGSQIYASQLAGSFTLPRESTQKLAFIAGGIGITPFRSMIKTMLDENSLRDIVLIYAVSDEKDFAYLKTFTEARNHGARIHLVATGQSTRRIRGVTYTKLDSKTLARLVPDIAERTSYISGPNAMVDGIKHELKTIGVRASAIKTDHFSGY